MRKVYVLTENTLWAEDLQPQMLALDCQLAHLHSVDKCRGNPLASEVPELVLLDYAQAHPKAIAELQRIWPHSEIVLFGEAPLPTVFADLLRLGVLHYFCVPVTDPHQLALVILGCVAKATLRREQSRLQARALHDAFHDPLTGLANGALLQERLTRALAAERPARPCAVLFLDLDRFKNVNDSLGHVEGDQLLIAIAERLKGCVRPSDLVARLGGDEFTILLEGIVDLSDARRAAERVQRALAAPITLSGQEVYVSASIGIAVSLHGDASAKNLVQDADTAMYRAKARGGGVYEMFDASMQTRAAQFLGLESNLRRALRKHEFALHYQPIVSFKTGEVAGFEALLRWISPERGLIGPVEFIPVAEQTGLIVPLGKWALGEACRQAKAWENLGPPGQPLFISVNISPRQFAHTELVDDVALVLQETGLSPECLKLEVTESLLIDTVPQALETMGRLRAMGVRLCVDDFGTGYSSLSTLSQFPIQTLKIDRAFVKRLGPDGKHGAIIDTVITLAHTLGMDVIAEGIETAEQLEQLRSRQCEYGQGYFFSRPVAQQEASALLMGSAILPRPEDPAARPSRPGPRRS
jgi:diguanylate cyclase (GGDEF)-like protein